MHSTVFSQLNAVHRLEGRVRWRFRTHAPWRNWPALEQAIAGLPGVLDVRINAAAHSLAVRFDPQATEAGQLESALQDLRLTPVDAVCAPPAQGAPDTREVACNAALLLGSGLLPPAARGALTLAASVPLYRHAWADLRSEGFNSHVLEALAVAISTASKDYTAANTTLFMLALGEYLEESIARRSDDMLKRLLRPNIGTVWVERDGQELQVAADALEVGDTVVVGAGATVPVDGTVLGGEALVNEAAMTGESVPVARKRGDRMLSGTVVEEGRIRIYAEHVGRGTAAARIADYVEQSLTAKSQIQLQASRMADRLVPGVLGLAGASWLLTGNRQRAAAVLQADYSCSLKLATPVAFKSSMFFAGQRGVLVKGAGVLERLAQTDTFVFDKTGTLTTGKLSVTDSVTFDAQFTAKDLIDLAASVEEHYFHPLAMAVVEAARRNHGRHFDHKEVEFIAAHGVASVIDGRRIVVGSRHFVEEDEGVPINAAQRRSVDRLFRQGKTLLYIGFGGRLIGVIALKDTVRENSRATIGRLRALGVRRIVMLTGDHHSRAAELAQALGLDTFHAELMPQQKAELVAQMKAQGARIAFVGDGINDAPALAGAEVGIAMQQGADIARLTSDVALLEDSIERVADVKEIANATMQLIDRNYRLTVGANTGILGAAALGLLRPITTSVLHNGTTIAILLNALRGGQKTLRARKTPHPASSPQAAKVTGKKPT